MRVGARFLSTGTFMERDTLGLEAALRGPTLILEDRTQPGKCYDSFSSTRSHRSNSVRFAWCGHSSVLGVRSRRYLGVSEVRRRSKLVQEAGGRPVRKPGPK